MDNALNQLPFVVFVQFSSLFLVGAYSIIWRYVSIEDIKAFLKAALLSGIILIAGQGFYFRFERFSRWQVPLSVILMDTLLAFGGLLGLRILRRFFYEIGEKRSFQVGKRRKSNANRHYLSAQEESAHYAVKEMVWTG